MPISYQINKQESLIISRHDGEISDKELIDTYDGLFQNDDAKKCLKILVDLRATMSTERSADALRTIADRVRIFHGNSPERTKTAIIAPRDLSFGLSRMYEAYSDEDHEEVMVFRDAQKALHWIGVAPNVFEKKP